MRAVLVTTAGAGAVLLAAIALHLADASGLGLVRFREITLAIEVLLLAAVLAGRDPKRRAGLWTGRLEAWLATPAFFRGSMAITLALFLLSALTQHWSFRTGSHDFSMIDEALDQSLHGRFLFSPVLGRSFLSEHFSPILASLVPLHAVFPTPYLLVVIQPLALWASGPALNAVLTAEGVRPAVRHLACLVFLHHAVTISTLDYLFHMECFLPLALFALHLAYRRGWRVGYAAALLLALSIKEDVGFYVAGYGAWLALAERRVGLGVATAAASLAWSLGAVQFAIPAFAPAGAGYAFLGRWDHWGHGLGGIVLGFASRPLDFAGALLAKPFLALFGSLLLLPFASRWGWLLVLAPWALNATSSLPPQHRLSLYYGIPLLACAALAAAIALGSPWVRGCPRWAGATLAVLAVGLNVSNLRYPRIPPERGAMVRAIRAIPDTASARLQWCFYPVAGYGQRKFLLWPGEDSSTDRVVVWTGGSTWPFSKVEAESLVQAAIRSGKYRNSSEIRGFYLLERLPDR